ncbi:MAG: ATP-binding cassette domain-containing protein [Burkholderiales bacterium]|jgi:zinc transport system ATP-binding protein|nr:ATP-binding cassette domain-containing protein [Burkholderiales bacterium]
MPDQSDLLRLDKITFSRNRRVILDAVDVVLHQNEIATLIGPNGAGKSTLLKIALGLIQPDRGTVWRKPGIRIGYVPQKLTVTPSLPMTVSRFVTLSVKAPRNEIQAVLEQTGVDSLIDASVHTLSGGEWQRVLLARALLSKPSLLLLDEPAQGLDVIGQNTLYDLIQRIRDDFHCGILLVSHDLHLVMASSDQVLCLQHHICCSGKPETLRQDPAYLALFGERNIQSLAAYHHRHDHEHTLYENAPVPLPFSPFSTNDDE